MVPEAVLGAEIEVAEIEVVTEVVPEGTEFVQEAH